MQIKEDDAGILEPFGKSPSPHGVKPAADNTGDL